MSDLIRFIEQECATETAELPKFGPGDTVNVHFRRKQRKNPAVPRNCDSD